MTSPFSVHVPCSSANLGSGFDTISAALSLILSIEVEPIEGDTIEWIEDPTQTSILPFGENLIQKSLEHTQKFLGGKPCGLRIQMHNPIPIRRGLGSSAAAIIAGAKIAEKLEDTTLDTQQIFNITLPLEGHPDNLAASLLGGWVLSRVNNGKMRAEQLQSPLKCRFVLCIPDITIDTSRARSILPKNYSLEDVTFNLQRCALLVHALHTGQANLFRSASLDRLHQPFRARLVPGLEQLLTRRTEASSWADSLLSISISGSGSAVLALVTDHWMEIGNWMVETLATQGTKSTYQVLDLDMAGARVKNMKGS